MVVVEKSFPRGGVGQKEAQPKEAKEHIIFGAAQKKLKKSKSKPKEDAQDFLETEKEDVIQTVSAELINYNTIQDGMNLMGMVKKVDQLYLEISLPGRMIARVSALEISDAYTKATRDFLEQSGSADKYKPLTELYSIGQIVYGKVLELKQHGHRTHINLSLKPSEVHAELIHSHVKKGFIFNGAIEEVQEHGYIIETGIKGIRCFMPNEKAQQDNEYVAGELVYMRVEKMTHDKAVSTCICKAIKAQSLKIKNQNEPNLDYLLPSTIVNFNVTKVLKDGLQGSIMNDAFTAYINEHQLTEPLALPEDFAVNSTLSARILYVMPLTKFVYLTLNLQESAAESGAEPDAADSDVQGAAFSKGEIIEKAKVHHVGTGGVILILQNKYKGFISYKTIKANYKGNYDQDELLVKYAKKTQHKVRILDYHLMDSLYICSDDVKILNEKIFSFSDIKIGEFVTATVKERNEKMGGYNMEIGKLRGIIEKLFLSPTSKHLEERTQVRCRILAINAEQNIVYLTNRPEYMSKTCKILCNLQDAKENSIYVGTIVQCNESYFLIKFFNNLKGVLHKPRITGYIANELDNFYEGQTMQFRIATRKDDQITLSLPEDAYKMGEICPVRVTHILEAGVEINVLRNDEDDAEDGGETKGLIPLRLLSDFSDLLLAKLHMLQNEQEIQAACMVKNIFSLRDVDYFTRNLTKDWRTVQPGDIMRAYVKNVEADVVHIMVPVRDYGKLVKIHLKMLLLNTMRNPNVVLSHEQVIFVKVLSKELATKTLTISAKLTDVWDGQLSSTAEYMNSYFQELKEIKKAFKKQGKPIGRLTMGDKVKAKILGVQSDTQDWHCELSDTKLLAIVKSTTVGKAKAPKVGAELECCILWIDYANELVYVTNNPGDMARITKSKKIAPNLIGKSGLNAKVVLSVEQGFICTLKKGQNPLIFCPTRLHYNDLENAAGIEGVKEGDFCKLAFINDAKPIAVLENTWKLWQNINRKRKLEVETVAAQRKKAKIAKVKKLEKEKLKEAETVSNKQKRKLAPNKLEAAAADKKQKNETEELFYEDKTSDSLPDVPADVHITDKKQSKTAIKPGNSVDTVMPGIADFWTTDLTKLHENTNDAALSSDDDDADDATQDPKHKKKLTTAEKFRQERQEEARLREIEEKNADPKQLPESADQFDRLVLSEPNNSKHWINYMVFHLQSTELDKARAVARRAIKAISFRNVDDQFNIWIALLNLELRYGTTNSYEETFKEALIYNDPQKIYYRVIEILSDAQKKEELIEMIGVVTRKFKQDQEAWRVAANAYFSINMPERAQQLLHKALVCLPEREHVNTIVMFSNLNHKHGNNEMAQTLLDQVVTSYPKRVDVWTQYVDLLVKSELIDSARCVLERAVIQKIPLKKMRTIFKKYLEFEERFGTDTGVEKVKKLAADYVKNNANL